MSQCKKYKWPCASNLFLTYQENIRQSMKWLAKQPNTIFLGEGIINAGRVYGTMNDVPLSKCIEMPICENLIVGAAMGMSLEGYIPIVVFQRMDFMLIAADAIINHLALIPKMSGGQVKFPVIIRAIVGSRDPKFDVGPQHNQDFTQLFKPYIQIATIGNNIFDISAKVAYETAYLYKECTLIIERKDDYELTC